MKFTTCFFDPETNVVIDLVNQDNLTVINKKSLEQIKVRFPQAIQIDFNRAIEIVENSIRSQPEEITEERYDEMLGVLPPVGFTTDSISQSFKLSERLSGLITTIFCQLEGRFYSFNDKITLKHHEIKEIIKNSSAYQNPNLTNSQKL